MHHATHHATRPALQGTYIMGDLLKTSLPSLASLTTAAAGPVGTTARTERLPWAQQCPSWRYGHSMVLAPRVAAAGADGEARELRGAAVLFGGGGKTQTFGDVWVYDAQATAACVLRVHRMCTACAPRVHLVHTACTPRAHRVCGLRGHALDLHYAMHMHMHTHMHHAPCTQGRKVARSYYYRLSRWPRGRRSHRSR